MGVARVFSVDFDTLAADFVSTDREDFLGKFTVVAEAAPATAVSGVITGMVEDCGVEPLTPPCVIARNLLNRETGLSPSDDEDEVDAFLFGKIGGNLKKKILNII